MMRSHKPWVFNLNDPVFDRTWIGLVLLNGACALVIHRQPHRGSDADLRQMFQNL